MRCTHLSGAQALSIARTGDEAFFAGDSARHVPGAVGGAVEGGNVSEQGPRTAPRSRADTVDTAVEKRERISKWVPELLQQGGTISGWHLHRMLSRSQMHTEMHTYPSVPASSRLEVSLQSQKSLGWNGLSKLI